MNSSWSWSRRWRRQYSARRQELRQAESGLELGDSRQPGRGARVHLHVGRLPAGFRRG